MNQRSKKSELRKDIVSGDWVVIAPGRAKRPMGFIKSTKRKRTPKSKCPFEDPQKSDNKNPIFFYPKNKPLSEWRLQVIENKFPALLHDKICAVSSREGPYEVMRGVGHHDLIITRDHDANFSKLSDEEAVQVFRAFQEHYISLYNDSCVEYISILHNWGPKAGATVYHPHYQMMSVPVIPPDVHRSLMGSKRYYEKSGRCVHCTILKWELKEKKRIIYESKDAVVFAPFISREPFEVRILPKKHLPYFEDTSRRVIEETALALKKVLGSMGKNLKDPDYNFFIHSAPANNKKKYAHYHWHIEVLPKFSVSAGFEIGTGIEVTVVDPDEAARILKI